MQRKILHEVCYFRHLQKHFYSIPCQASFSMLLQNKCHSILVLNSPHIKAYKNKPLSISLKNTHVYLVRYLSKEPSKVKETDKVLKEENGGKSKDEVVSTPPKRSIGKRIWDELVHYYHGFRLLFIDIRIASRLVWKILKGKELTRREHRQLVRTVSDLFRLVPFSIFLLIPFMELLLPVVVKLFPAILPSTFATTSEKEKKFKTQLKINIEMARFLQDTLDEMALVDKDNTDSHTAKELVLFFEKIRTSGEQASNEDIMKFSKLFEDEITLDSLSRPTLIALCRLLEVLQPIGTNNFLRFQLRMKLRSLKADDQMIQREGIDALTVNELQAACRARGMRALGMPENRLRSQLEQWLELSLNMQVPPSLLLLSRALYLPEHLPAPDKMKATLSSLPDTATAEAKLKTEGRVDNKTKLELIKKEEDAIKKEAEELVQEMINEQKEAVTKKDLELDPRIDILAKDMYILIDKAKDKTATDKKKELSKEDFDDLEDALENIAREKHKLIIEKDEIEDLKEEMANYKHGIEELKYMVLESDHKELVESKAALRLSNKVNKMISKLDNVLEDLSIEEVNVQQKIEDKAKEGVSTLGDRDDIISISELLLAIKRIQKVSDDSRLQRIADVLEKMDVDYDGSVKVAHVLKVIELLGKDNVKVSSEQMDEIIDLLVKEDSLELEEKIRKQVQIQVQDESSSCSKTEERQTK